MADEISEILADVGTVLRKGGDTLRADQIEEAQLGGIGSIERFVCSNELWGGAGSIADQSLLEDKPLRSDLERLLVRLGRAQIAAGKINERTSMWVEAFEKWQKASAM